MARKLYRSHLEQFELCQVVLFRNRYSSSESTTGGNEIMLMHDQGSAPEGRMDANMADSDYVVTPCGNGSYCCGNGTLADNCCRENRGLFVKDGRAVSPDPSSHISDIALSSSTKATPSSSSSAAVTLSQSLNDLSSAASASSSSSAALESLSPSSDTKPLHQTGVIVGAAIGGAAALALITGTIVLIGMRRIQYKSRNYETPQAAWRHDRAQDHGSHGAIINNTSRALVTVGPVSELDNSEESHKPVPELESSTRFHRQ